MKKFLVAMIALATLSGGGWVVSLAARAAPDGKDRPEFGSPMAKAHPEQAKAMLAALNEMWAVDAAAQETTGRGIFSSAEETYCWSRRTLEAERALAGTQQDDLAALLNHWQRMEQVYRQVHALYETGSKGGEHERLARTKYYRAEAELWLVAAGGRVPDERLK
ncbi:MAG: hypothetical protein ACREHD_21450 [Pirellulales bacterium]